MSLQIRLKRTHANHKEAWINVKTIPPSMGFMSYDVTESLSDLTSGAQEGSDGPPHTSAEARATQGQDGQRQTVSV